MVDGHTSAQKAEQIYDEKQVLQSIRDHIMKPEIQQSMDEIQGLPRGGHLESRIGHSRRQEKEIEIEQMECDYQGRLRDTA